MYRKLALILALVLAISPLSACMENEPEALSGVAPSTVDVAPQAIDPSVSFYYDGEKELADSFNQMNSLRLAICDTMYSAVSRFSEDSAWVPVAASKFVLGSDEFLAASFVEKKDPDITATQLMEDSDFQDIKIKPVMENSWTMSAIKKNENNSYDTYDYTIMYGPESDSCRFTLEINKAPTMLFASRRITGGYAIQVWTPEGTYKMLAHDVKEGRFGFIPSRDVDGTTVEFPSTDIFYDGDLITNTFISDGAEYTFLLANEILYIATNGKNYAVPIS